MLQVHHSSLAPCGQHDEDSLGPNFRNLRTWEVQRHYVLPDTIIRTGYMRCVRFVSVPVLPLLQRQRVPFSHLHHPPGQCCVRLASSWNSPSITVMWSCCRDCGGFFKNILFHFRSLIEFSEWLLEHARAYTLFVRKRQRILRQKRIIFRTKNQILMTSCRPRPFNCVQQSLVVV